MNSSTSNFVDRYEEDRSTWNSCAGTYEQQIVSGHPDITDYEAFEHSFVDRLVLELVRDKARTLHVYDFGCGSGRFHRELARYLTEERINKNDTNQDRLSPAAGGIAHIGGVDFSSAMIELARTKLTQYGLGALHPHRLSFSQGSAFDVKPYAGPSLPLALSVCNSIGVMQGEEGAKALFDTMRHYVEPCKGLALISCYRKAAVGDYALGNYESTMDVCGQPAWLDPPTWANPKWCLKPRAYKRSGDPSAQVIVDIYDSAGQCVEKGVTLLRNEEAVRQVKKTGIIRTHSSYQSCWYSVQQIKDWMKTFWHGAQLWHVEGASLDKLRGVPAQIALADFSGCFESFGRRLGLTPLV